MYLGGFDNEEQAALAYDIAAIKFRAHDANTNFNISNYEQELKHFDEVLMRSQLQQSSMHSYALEQQFWSWTATGSQKQLPLPALIACTLWHQS